ncbi:prolyl oligopeptidase family serine peptidase [Corynebacterium qintianiae]|uniref:S9 family peptidase n=1 Tax=Corynebacterium qintianiae TaxID=2709392 RepID=UPI0013EBD6FA|nr:prolyl oligopeptidase family serine peptidase [Corynebacterium qintianiae]
MRSSKGDTRFTYGPSLSPDGSEIAFIVRDDAYPYAVQAQIEADGAVGRERRVRIPVDGPVTRVLHSPDGKWLACEAAPHGSERSEIWLVTTDPDDSSATGVNMPGDVRVRIVEWDRQYLAVAAFQDDGVTEARLVDPFAGTHKVLDRRADSMLVDCEGGYSLMRVGPRGNRELLLIHPDGTWQPLLPPDPGATVDGGVVLPLDEGQEGPPPLVIHGDWGANRRRLMRIDFTGGLPEMTVIAEYGDADVEQIVFSRDKCVAAVLWCRNGVSKLEVMVMSPLLKISARRSIDLPGMVASNLSVTSNGSLLALTVQGPDVKPQVKVFRPKIALGEVMRGAQITDNAPDHVSYTARDGLELSGWFYRARHPEEKRPMLVHLHGGPEGQSRPEYHDVLTEVMRAGISVFTPNVRGSSGYGRSFVNADNRYGRFAGIRDLEDTVDFLVSIGLADPGRVAVSGRSYGGFLTLQGMTAFPELFRCGIAACGMSDIQTFYRDTEPWIASAAYPKYGYPIQDAELLKCFSPLAEAARVTAPVMFIHGEHDTNVPPSESRQMKQALDARGVPTRLLLFEDEGHEFLKRHNRERIAAEMLDFLGAHGMIPSE